MTATIKLCNGCHAAQPAARLDCEHCGAPFLKTYCVRLTYGNVLVSDCVQALNIDEQRNNFPDGATSETQRVDK